MKVAHRLYLTTAPAVLGVLTVAGLAYWGQYAHTIPELFLVIAVIASIGTLVLAWRNVRDLAQRVERLAAPTTFSASDVRPNRVANAVSFSRGSEPLDELDAIESTVVRLSSAVALAETDRIERERTFEERAHEYASMLAHVAVHAVRRIDDIRLPLHILLENHFGDLNENQEELLGAARNATETANIDLAALRQIAELDLGTRTHRGDRILPGDMVRAIVPTLKAIAEKLAVVFAVDLEPLVPAVRGDQAQLQDALSTLLGDAVAAAKPGVEVRLMLRGQTACARIDLHGAGMAEATIRATLAERILHANGASMSREGATISIFLVAWAPCPTARK